MLRGEMRTVLRRRLQEDAPSGGRFDEDVISRLLTLGVQEVQKKELAINPEAYKVIDQGDILVASTDVAALYPWPVGSLCVIELGMGTPADGYTKLERITLKQAREGVSGFVPWSSSHFMLSPRPSTAVTKGLQAITVPALTMADDSEVCPLPLNLHLTAVRAAELIALGDTGEASDKIRAEIAEDFKGIPQFYLTATDPAFLMPQIERY